MIEIEKRHISRQQNEDGYTLLEVIIVAAIIGILVTIGTAHYLEAKRLSQEHMCATRLSNLAVLQNMFFREYGYYANFAQLQEARLLDEAYTSFDPIDSQARPYIPEYNLFFNIDVDRYQIVALPRHGDFEGVYVRWRTSGGMEDVRGMYVDETGVVRYTFNDRPVF